MSPIRPINAPVRFGAIRTVPAHSRSVANELAVTNREKYSTYSIEGEDTLYLVTGKEKIRWDTYLQASMYATERNYKAGQAFFNAAMEVIKAEVRMIDPPEWDGSLEMEWETQPRLQNKRS